MTHTKANDTQQEDNARVRVTQWHLPPASETGHHVHQYDYVVVPLTEGKLTIYNHDGSKTEASLAPGQSYFRNAGVSHNVTNQGTSDIVFVEIEIKRGT